MAQVVTEIHVLHNQPVKLGQVWAVCLPKYQTTLAPKMGPTVGPFELGNLCGMVGWLIN